MEYAGSTTEIDFSEVMARVHEVIGENCANMTLPSANRGMGVDVIEGKATLVSPWEVEVNGQAPIGTIDCAGHRGRTAGAAYRRSRRY